ncbi:MAG: hypothetical protein U5K54_29515 [Cytophagales bacterium]|nr:hypothetical protein [Cytophagales bacterium]
MKTTATTPRVPSNAVYQDGMYHIKPILDKGFEYNADAEKESKRMQALQRRIEKGGIQICRPTENDQLGVDELSQSGDSWSIGVSPVPQWIDEYPPSKVWASSTLASSKNTSYEVANVMDYDLRTVWSEGATRDSVGWIRSFFNFPAPDGYRK